MTLSSLSAVGDPQGFDKSKTAEINAVLHLKPIFNASIEVLPDLKWVYYTSKNNFIYIMPNYKCIGKICVIFFYFPT